LRKPGGRGRQRTTHDSSLSLVPSPYALLAQINLDEIEDLHEDVSDLLVDADEINEVLSRD
jgi:hypothetical protein